MQDSFLHIERTRMAHEEASVDGAGSSEECVRVQKDGAEEHPARAGPASCVGDERRPHARSTWHDGVIEATPSSTHKLGQTIRSQRVSALECEAAPTNHARFIVYVVVRGIQVGQHLEHELLLLYAHCWTM